MKNKMSRKSHTLSSACSSTDKAIYSSFFLFPQKKRKERKYLLRHAEPFRHFRHFRGTINSSFFTLFPQKERKERKFLLRHAEPFRHFRHFRHFRGTNNSSFFIFHSSLKKSILLLSLLLLTASCEKNVRYSALDGFWQVTSVEDKATRTVTNPEGRLYISFECELAKLSYLTEDHNTGFLGFEYIGSFTQQGDSLRFSTFYVYHYTNPQETTPAPADHLKAFGIHAQPASFALRMTRSDMTLDNAETRLTLRKY